jgi:hypothetical protein
LGGAAEPHAEQPVVSPRQRASIKEGNSNTAPTITSAETLRAESVRLDSRFERIRERAAALRTEIEALVDLEDPTPGQTQRLEDALTAAGKLDVERSEIDTRQKEILRAFAGMPGHVQSGDGARVFTAKDGKFQAMRRGGDPWEGEIRGVSDVEFRARALYACDLNEHVNEDGAEIVEGLVGDPHDPTNVAARWAIATSRPAYRSAFEKYLRHPTDTAMYLDEQERHAFQQVEEVRAAWAEGSNTTGGFAVPIDYDLNLLLINSASRNPFREISDVKQTVGQTYRGLSSAGVTASWNTESTEASDATPTVAGPSWTVLLSWATRVEASAQRMRERLGLDPKAEAELARERADATHATFDLEAVLAKGREVIASRALGSGGDDGDE